jgi:hypothetical protein
VISKAHYQLNKARSPRHSSGALLPCSLLPATATDTDYRRTPNFQLRPEGGRGRRPPSSAITRYDAACGIMAEGGMAGGGMAGGGMAGGRRGRHGRRPPGAAWPEAPGA